jgi:hypothetical protein
MDSAELAAQLDELFDCELVHHGFTSYMRDYELIVYQSADPRSGVAPRHLRFLFRCCPEASVTSMLTPETWACSLDDRLLDQHHVTMQSSGYVWGVHAQALYPAAAVVDHSDRARWWTEQVGVPFHEVEVPANAHHIRIVFTKLEVSEVAVGWTPFTVGQPGIAEDYAAGSKIAEA